jgi:probable rRNA maturation factor
VEAADEQAALAVDVVHLAEVARGVLVERRVARGELSLTFVDEDTIAELNRRHLGGKGPTDVLAFPLDAGGDGDVDPTGPGGDMPVLLGDVVVCPAVAARNAAARSVPTDDELALLVVHGVLHVLGMDHADAGDAALMQAEQRRLLERLHPPAAALWRLRATEQPPSSTTGSARAEDHR